MLQKSMCCIECGKKIPKMRLRLTIQKSKFCEEKCFKKSWKRSRLKGLFRKSVLTPPKVPYIYKDGILKLAYGVPLYNKGSSK